MFNRDRFLLLLPWCIALVLAGVRPVARRDGVDAHNGRV